MRHTFQAAQWVPHPIERVFAFFADPRNLPRLMPAWQKARIEQTSLVAPPHRDRPVSSPGGAFAGAGSRMTITFQALPLIPIRMRWEALIVDFAWDRHFCDEQPRGPFAYWRHCHRVSTEVRQGVPGTRVLDDLVYELPLGTLAEPAHALFVRRQIEGIFHHRRKQLLALL